jgi:hypothetical protein
VKLSSSQVNGSWEIARAFAEDVRTENRRDKDVLVKQEVLREGEARHVRRKGENVGVGRPNGICPCFGILLSALSKPRLSYATNIISFRYSPSL